MTDHGTITYCSGETFDDLNITFSPNIFHRDAEVPVKKDNGYPGGPEIPCDALKPLSIYDYELTPGGDMID